jgi:hypothetical protein
MKNDLLNMKTALNSQIQNCQVSQVNIGFGPFFMKLGFKVMPFHYFRSSVSLLAENMSRRNISWNDFRHFVNMPTKPKGDKCGTKLKNVAKDLRLMPQT